MWTYPAMWIQQYGSIQQYMDYGSRKSTSYQLHRFIELFLSIDIFSNMEPVHNGASNEIKEIKVCKKCPKVKPYCVPIFDPNMFKPFLDD